MIEIVGACSGDIPHTYEAWPIYLSPVKVARVQQVESRLFEFIQIVANRACGINACPLWKLTASGYRYRTPESAKSRAWLTFFLLLHPSAKLSSNQAKSIVNRDRSTMIYYRRELLGRLSDGRFSKEAYSLKNIAYELEKAGFESFEIDRFSGVTRLVGIRSQPAEGAAA